MHQEKVRSRTPMNMLHFMSRKSSLLPSPSSFVGALVLLVLATTSPCVDAAFGGEIRKFDTIPFTQNVTHRQDVCGRYDMFRNGEIDLRDALNGLELRPLMRLNGYFNYDDEDGLNRNDPGLMGNLMDELGQRAGFTWRNSFGVLYSPDKSENVTWTWTEMLLWGVETYDVSVNWWDKSVERMDSGVAFLEPWFDGSLILIDKRDPPKSKKSNKINWFNWLSPFEHSVWYVTILTIVASGWVFQFLEYMSAERNERPFFQWMMDNLYLSALNSTQNFEYAPGSMAGRFFAFSMAMWALIMTATYTANLASLFVDENSVGLQIESIDHAVRLGIPICTYANTNADTIIKEKFPKAIRIPKLSEIEAYDSLHAGECGLVAAYKANWLGYERDRRYNPTCDLEWVGRTVEDIQSGFAVKADAGYKCTSLIRDVINLHLNEMISAGALAEAWEKHYSKSEDIDCSILEGGVSSENKEGEADGTRRGLITRKIPVRDLLQSSYSSSTSGGNDASSPAWRQRQRSLKSGGGGGGGAAGKSSGDIDISSAALTLRQMAGTFAFHWISMLVSIAISFGSLVYKKYFHEDDPFTVIEKVVYRTHGPIIGQPPPVNTYVKRRSDNLESQEQQSIKQQHGTSKVDQSLHTEPDSGSGASQENNNSSEMQSLQIALEQAQKQLQNSQAQLALALDDSESVNHNTTNEKTSDLNYNIVNEQQELMQLQLKELGASQQQLQIGQQELSRQMRMVVSMLRDMRNNDRQQPTIGLSSGDGGLFG